jgi:lysophospholipase L1-like esterase
VPVIHGLLELARPNTRAISRNVYHRTNSRGIRGPEYRPQPPEGVFRIAVTGDSTTMGSGVLEGDRYTDLLARRLGDGYEVLNVGLSGLDIRAVVERLRRLSRHYSSHLFVYGFSLNDIEGPSYRSRATALPPADFTKAFWSTVAAAERSPSYFVRFLLAWWFGFNVTTKGSDEIRENFLENPEAWDDFLTGLEDFAALARTHGVCAHVLLHAHLGQLDEQHPYLQVYDRVERAALQRGLSVTQSFPYFATHESGDAKSMWVSLFDPHPNREGHTVLAEALHDGLEKLPSRCWER